MLLISKTFQIITEESAKNGEASENGFEFQDGEYSFRELVKELKEYNELSCSHDHDRNTWVTQYGDMDLHSGDYTNYSLHFSRNNPARKEKYWIKALRLANLSG